MKKILIGYLVGDINSGINKYIDTFAKAIRKDDVKIDFLTRESNSYIDEYISKNNFNNLHKISRNRRPIKQLNEMIKLIKREKYDIAYFNISESFNCIGIIAAKLCGVKKIIVHSHAAGENTKNVLKRKIQEILNFMCKPIISVCCNSYLTCSDLAAKWLYSKSIVKNKRYELIYNVVDDKKFKYNKRSRDTIREKLDVKDKFIIGHVGRICEQKNQRFLLNILKNVFDKKDNAMAIIIGDGEDLDEIKQYAKELKIDQKIIFTGNVDNVEEYMSAFDIFVLPSKFEGLPIVGVEAQFCGLPCLFSDKISSEILLGDNSKLLSIDNTEVWVDCLLEYSKRKNKLLPIANKYKIENVNQNIKTIIE